MDAEDADQVVKERERQAEEEKKKKEAEVVELLVK